MRKIAIGIVAGVITASVPATSIASAEPTIIPTADFARHARVMSPRLSPDGQYVSVRMDDDSGDQHALVIYRLTDMSVASMLRMPKYELPLNAVWVSPTRLVVSKGRAYGSIGAPAATGELIATDVDGKHQDYLYGYEQAGSRARTRGKDRGFGSIDSLPRTPNGHFYMSARPWGNENSSVLYDVDAEKNTRRLIAEMHVYGMNFLVDPDGNSTFAYGTDAEFEFHAYRKQGKGWSPIDLTASARFMPFAYSEDKNSIYAFTSTHGEPLALVTERLDGSQRVTLASDSFANVAHMQWTAPPEQPFAAGSDAGIPNPRILKPDLFAAKLYAKLRSLFPGLYVDFINFSQDGTKLLFSTASDRDPGSYYLLDTKTLKVAKLFDTRPWIKPAQMGERRPIRFKASDGLELEAYLTLPPQRGEKNLPMVLLPHGGPHGVRDDWFYDNDAQFLANRGYLVLQVNYRGSGGRGDAFEEAGYLEWGSRIQQDLIDGVKWAIEQGYADKNRICVYGGSFGGYSAMMSVVREPGMFRCAIGYAGIYDLAMMYKKGDIRARKSGRSYLTTVIGKDDEALDANSPDKLADQIKLPVLLIHGKNDKRAPYAQAEAMRAALETAGNPPEWLVKNGEGHGFYDENNAIEAFDTIAGFLDKHIGNHAGESP